MKIKKTEVNKIRSVKSFYFIRSSKKKYLKCKRSRCNSKWHLYTMKFVAKILEDNVTADFDVRRYCKRKKCSFEIFQKKIIQSSSDYFYAILSITKWRLQ